MYKKINSVDTQVLYMPKRLRDKLAEIAVYPTTVIEAPSGFGKTTALDMYFDNSEFETVPVYRVTLLNQSVFDMWSKICSVIDKIDANCAAVLKSIAVIDESTAADIEEALQNMEVAEKTYIVIDNLGDVRYKATEMLVNMLMRHPIYNLHVIISLLQLPGISRVELLQNRKIYTVNGTDFTFSRDDIYSYYKRRV